MSIALHGIGVSKGVAIGAVHIIDHVEIDVNEYTLSRQSLETEIIRFQEALDTAREQLTRIRTHVTESMRVDLTAFIDTHLMMLEDDLLTDAPVQIIRQRQCNAEWALKIQCDNLVKIFEEMEDPYLSARKQDVVHVVTRIQRILKGYETEPAHESLIESLADRIVVADDLSPADTVLMQHQGVLAFVTEFGGTTSHTAILARSLGIPAIVGLRRVRGLLRANDMLIVDGGHGVVIVDPDEATLSYYRQRQREEKRYRASLNKIKHSPTRTLDGVDIALQANIEFPEDMTAVKRVGCESVGLYRTEFLYMNRQQAPDEEEHLDAYVRVLQSLRGGPVTIRTLDLGADKQVDSRIHLSPSANPALGLRAIRLCLRDLQLFRPQLRAILRASAKGHVRLMVPMVSSPQEMIQVRNLIGEIRNELIQKKIPFDPQMPIGAMIEVPALAICVDLFTPYADFFSIGTNDLIQYSLAIDRVDNSVNYLYDPLHPAVLRLIKMSIDAANKAAKSVSMCGEMAGDQRYVRLLLGLGLRAFSVNPESFLEVKQTINHSEIKGLIRLANRMLKAKTNEEVTSLLEQINGTK
ncbi:phosphoenolpyruvate--protein phosphotransferase [Thioflexithrix psekupsensis]|uniref:Phosphoenolpyruvate-protein phosphotransferase n=1 Tax=Thioflexithrix psekupsensis TaxID=1570016 RepID=A0A251X842_9GAMM|nr:phosphoenolpyruvate--protein phosphotransferase [Thioflexithrix psekupsensis]OUD14228.1 phosphoenolpyruvate--protein phosphotransferase [Thioflexithrix psekupsensis]